MSLEANKQVVVEFWTAMMQADLAGMAALLATDVKIYTIGDMPCGGLRSKQEFLDFCQVIAQNVASAGSMRLGELTAQGERVAVEVETSFFTRSGKRYNNQYMWLFFIHAGRIVGLKEYCDTLHAFETLEGEFIKGPRIKRISNLWTVTTDLSGDPRSPHKGD
jgi:ketosteroid isomerase-like protein